MKKHCRILSMAVATGILLAGCGTSQKTQETTPEANASKNEEIANNTEFENVTTEYEDKFMSQNIKIHRLEAVKPL